MRTKRSNNAGFSLLEVLLASIIFVVTIGGLFVTLNAIRMPVVSKENALSAAVFGKQVLEALHSQVNATTFYTCSQLTGNGCNDFSLYLGVHQVTLPQNGFNWPLDGVLAAANNNILSYTVSCADGNPPATCAATTARVVNLNIKWPDATS